MRLVIQRVKQAKVEVDSKTVGTIGQGLLILVGIENLDGEEDVLWLTKKISQLRVFSDENGYMNCSVKDVRGDLLLISQFTLFGSTKKGNRPSFIKSAKPEVAEPLYENMKKKLAEAIGKPIASGIFGADMQVSLINDGPVTLIIDSKNKE